MLSAQTAGDRLLFDYFGIGGSLTYERRRSFFSNANDYTLNASALVSYPLGQAYVSAALRFLWFEIGVMGGYRVVWRNLSFAPGEDRYCLECDRAARRRKDPILGSGPTSDHFPFAEARIQLYAPFNDYFVLSTLLAASYQGVQPRSYDWLFTDVHDAGVIMRWELLAFVKHRDWGGIGPYLQFQSLPRAGKHEPEFAFGFNLAVRPGIIDRNDLFFLTVLMRPGDPYYGQHAYFAPVRALFFYRIALQL